VERLRREQNEVAQATGRAKNPTERAGLVERGKELKHMLVGNERNLEEKERDLKKRLSRIPNFTHPDAPIGHSEDDSKVLRTWGTPRAFDFKPRDHVEIGKALDLIDFEAGGKVAGHGFYFLKNEGALLDLALQNFAMQTLIRRGFTPIVTPDLARNK